MSAKHARTRSDAACFGASVRINCRDCGATRTLSGAEIAKDYGAGSLGITAKHLKCGHCGAKYAQLMVLPLH